ncbi:uncharacterized protein LOC135437753 [Drosophila montana]|uniref:uncharacterized protein LOC135437753 n=1 Tax=Drosophila montana TaxID=40370 RepID=UPI00313F2273
MTIESVSMLTRKCAILCILLPLLRAGFVLASESCHYCRGINCQRSNYEATEQCVDQLDACVSVFEGGVVKAQGCLELLEGSWREPCESRNHTRIQCEICVTEKCNNVSARQLSCLQCTDTEDDNCRTAPEQLAPQACGIARSGRSLCYASIKEQRVERGCSLTLSEQRTCLADANCQLCDPLEISHCNYQLLEDTAVTTEPPGESTSSTSSSSSSSTSTSTSSSTTTTTSSTASPPTTQSTIPPTKSPTDPPTPSPQPDSAQSLCTKNIPILLLALQLVMYFYDPNK